LDFGKSAARRCFLLSKLADVAYWHLADMPPAPTNVCFQR
jgi:hypothetical protein